MSVNWLWKNKIGEIQVEQTHPETKRNFKLSLYRGNCLCVLIYHYKKDNEKWYNFYAFFDDKKHAERCLGLRKSFDGTISNIYGKNEPHYFKKAKLNVFFSETKILAELFVKAGMKVELYYKEPKEVKHHEKHN